MIQELVASAAVAVAAWFVVNFVGKPVVALQKERIAALQTAERYYTVDGGASDEVRDAAEKALFETGTTLRAYQRGWSTAVRLWCWVWGYDLGLAAQAMFGLADSARGTVLFPPDVRKNTLNAIYVALGAHQHLAPETVASIKQMIVQARSAPIAPAHADGAPS
ncbi:hypothetical protein SR870_02455 [Rhodopseudomonas palustris]|uniref:hypothetical protein n=1 Tax=Rhodopseudomonas palustris TaxID=1076 RepID=UPI002ACDB978|nr:hypothetical protein [Rhodopseudomonas palustris]WQH00175.1 hypothetical protein SR870_02455 [Rhodopseudomonas palustris]